MRVEPLRQDHLDRLTVQEAQAEWAKDCTAVMLTAGQNRAWCALVDDKPIAAAGLLDMGGGRRLAWALLTPGIGSGMLPLHKTIVDHLGVLDYRRIECVTAANFQPARRWAEMLGFTCEGTMRAYCQDGSDALLWARVR